MEPTYLARLTSVIELGSTIISAEHDTILAIVQSAVESGRSATFYLPVEHAEAINTWYWTPERMAANGMEAVTAEEIQRIETELGIKDAGIEYSNRIPCSNCDKVYGAFEFVQQGIRQHGRETAETALKLEGTYVLRVNPTAVAICPSCGQPLMSGGSPELARSRPHYYICRQYGCCMVV